MGHLLTVALAVDYNENYRCFGLLLWELQV